jgi:hypothetical protein
VLLAATAGADAGIMLLYVAVAQWHSCPAPQIKPVVEEQGALDLVRHGRAVGLHELTGALPRVAQLAFFRHGGHTLSFLLSECRVCASRQNWAPMTGMGQKQKCPLAC